MTDSARPATAAGSQRPLVTAIGDVRPQDRVDVSGIIRSAHAMSISGTPACRYVLADSTGQLDLLFLGRLAVTGLERGRHCRAEGRAAVRDGRITLWNPRYWLQPSDTATQDIASQEFAGQNPVAQELPTLTGQPAGERRPGSGPAGRILVADDDKAIRRVLKVSLAARGYHVDLAATAAAAIDLARRRPDLVILDIGLPDINGLTAVAAIRASCDAPIIVISAREAVDARTAALAAGADDYLPKPFAIGTLLAKLPHPPVPGGDSQRMAGAAVPARG